MVIKQSTVYIAGVGRCEVHEIPGKRTITATLTNMEEVPRISSTLRRAGYQHITCSVRFSDSRHVCEIIAVRERRV